MFYMGVLVPEGKVHSTWLSEHADFVSLFRRFLLWGGTRFSSLLGYPATHDDYMIYVEGVAGVRIIYTCLGFGLISAYTALLLGWPGRWQQRLISGAIGIVMIIVLNMMRLGGLAVLFVTGHYDLFDNVNHHDIFNGIVLFICFLLFVRHVRAADRANREVAPPSRE